MSFIENMCHDFMTIDEIRLSMNLEPLSKEFDNHFKSDENWIYPTLKKATICKGCGNISRDSTCKYCGREK